MEASGVPVSVRLVHSRSIRRIPTERPELAHIQVRNGVVPRKHVQRDVEGWDGCVRGSV